MTNLRRFFLSSDSPISERDYPTGTWCRAADALLAIESLQEKVADLQAQIATLQLDNATIAGLAVDEQNIFSYSTSPDNAA